MDRAPAAASPELAGDLEAIAGRDPAEDRVHPLVDLMKPEQWDAVRGLLSGLTAALGDVAALMASRQPLPLAVFVEAHRVAIERARASTDAAAGDSFWAAPGGAALGRLFDAISARLAPTPRR